MKRLELICDNCDKVAKGDEYHFGLPKGWYIVGYHCQTYLAYDDWRVLGHFCSFGCLEAKLKITGKEKTATFEVQQGGER